MCKKDDAFNKEIEIIFKKKEGQTEILELEMTMISLGCGVEKIRRCWLKSTNFQL